ncbi:MAG: serine/threonine protein kinase [Thermoproteota archaeon]|nr:serine/threonine protein kinase [Thermoproteota archaeon]
MSQQNISFSNELDIRSPRLLPLITYPHYSESEYKDRIIDMESLGITSIILGGKTIVNGSHVAGKGCVGIVVKAKAWNTVYALKIRRTDADRKTMDKEARFHKIANSVEVGPRLEGQTKNIIAMEYVSGQNIVEWVADTKRSRVRSVARAVLEQCFRLDTVGLDHGELSRLARHVIVSDRSYIIDFESASTTRKTSNVTAAAQSIFLYGTVANRVKKILDNTNREKEVIHALRTYKHSHTRANFEAVLDSLLI